MKWKYFSSVFFSFLLILSGCEIQERDHEQIPTKENEIQEQKEYEEYKEDKEYEEEDLSSPDDVEIRNNLEDEAKLAENVNDSDNSFDKSIITNPNRKIAYKSENDLILFDPKTKEKLSLLNSSDIIDFDLSQDQKLLAYTLKETGFEENSDVYLKNLITGDTIRLTTIHNIARKRCPETTI